MSGINKIILIGNLGKDPDVKTTEKGKKVANFTVATSEKYKDHTGQEVNKTEWHRIVQWGKLAEITGKYLKKGSKVYCEGKLETRKWTDKTGVERYTTEINCHTMQMLSPFGNKEGSGDNVDDRMAKAAQGDFSSPPPPDDDLPF